MSKSNGVLITISPSQGIGGGIERYINWVHEALDDEQLTQIRLSIIDQTTPLSYKAKMAFVFKLIKAAVKYRSCENVNVIVFHPSLFLISHFIFKLAIRRNFKGCVFFYGQDIWMFGFISRKVLIRSNWKIATISNYSMGAISAIKNAPVLTPTVGSNYYVGLMSVAPKDISRDDGKIRIITVFRLEAAEQKGLNEVFDAIDILRRRDINCELTVVGSGHLPIEFQKKIDRIEWATMVANVSDETLIQLYSTHDIFVLATRTKSQPPTSGEGLGLVLMEAQLAGLPVIAPAFGGSGDAYISGVTGIRPYDESAESLAEAIYVLASDGELLKRLSENARNWSSVMFDPTYRRYQTRRTLSYLLNLDLLNSDIFSDKQTPLLKSIRMKIE